MNVSPSPLWLPFSQNIKAQRSQSIELKGERFQDRSVCHNLQHNFLSQAAGVVTNCSVFKAHIWFWSSFKIKHLWSFQIARSHGYSGIASKNWHPCFLNIGREMDEDAVKRLHFVFQEGEDNMVSAASPSSRRTIHMASLPWEIQRRGNQGVKPGGDGPLSSADSQDPKLFRCANLSPQIISEMGSETRDPHQQNHQNLLFSHLEAIKNCC